MYADAKTASKSIEFVGKRSSDYRDALSHYADVWLPDIACMKRCLAPRPGERILEVGAGNGYFSTAIAECLGPDGLLVASDPSVDQLSGLEADSTHGNIRVVPASADVLDIPFSGFDAVWSRGAIHHVTDKTSAFTRFSALARPGGRLVIADIFAGTPLARYFDGQRSMRPVQWAFFATAFIGVLMVKGFDERINWLYFSLGVISAMAAAVAYLATMKCRETDHPVGVVIWFHLIAVPVTGSWTAFTWVAPVGVEWLLALAVGLLSVVAQVAMTFALHRGEANVIMPFKYVGAILAFFFGLLLFDERLSAFALAGMALVIASVTANTLLKRRAAHREMTDATK